MHLLHAPRPRVAAPISALTRAQTRNPTRRPGRCPVRKPDKRRLETGSCHDPQLVYQGRHGDGGDGRARPCGRHGQGHRRRHRQAIPAAGAGPRRLRAGAERQHAERLSELPSPVPERRLCQPCPRPGRAAGRHDPGGLGRGVAETGTLTRAQATEILRGRSAGDVPSAGSAAAAEAAGGGSAAQNERALGLSVAQRSAVQAGLTRRGFDTRGVDGTFGPGTRRAIANWQRANDLSSTGYLTGAQFQRLTTR
ncbi:MAG: hypothetical protein DI636_08945 [Pelagerythrobacter marensis]|nr:MAG: hypothetical protein DI636_08945 [Pelagerythrobacter marensis]